MYGEKYGRHMRGRVVLAENAFAFDALLAGGGEVLYWTRLNWTDQVRSILNGRSSRVAKVGGGRGDIVYRPRGFRLTGTGTRAPRMPRCIVTARPRLRSDDEGEQGDRLEDGGTGTSGAVLPPELRFRESHGDRRRVGERDCGATAL